MGHPGRDKNPAVVYAIRRLALGLALIGGAAGVLLVSDLSNRQRVRGSVPRVALFQISSRPGVDLSRDGVLAGLAEDGFVDGRTLVVERFNAENDLPTANAIAHGIVHGGFDLAITLTTPALQVLATANRDGRIPHVFGVVTDPAGSGVGIGTRDPLDHPRHLAGIGTFQPVREAFRLAQRIRPQLRSVGVVWCPGEKCSEACVLLARETAGELGVTLLEAPVDNSAGVYEAAVSLTARGAEALWVGGDNTVETAVGEIVTAADRARIPVFVNTPDHVEMGALFGLGADYAVVGRAVGRLAGRVLNGLDPASVPVENRVPPQLSINATVLPKLDRGWEIPPDVRAAAAVVIDAAGRQVRPDPDLAALRALGSPDGSTARRGESPPARRWRLHLIDYNESPIAADSADGLREEFKRLGLEEGRDFTLRRHCAQGDLPTLIALADAVAAEGADLILAHSTPVLQTLVKKEHRRPIVFGVVADPVRAGAGRNFTDHLPNVTGICTRSDFEGMARVIRQCLPGARRIGSLFATVEDNSIYNKDMFEAELRRLGITLVPTGISSGTEVMDAARAIVNQDVDLLCPVTSNMLEVAFAGVSRVAWEARIPLFTFTSTQVEQGAAAVGVARDYRQAGRDMARLAVRVMRGEPPAAIPFELVSRTRIVVNPDNAARCGLAIPPDLMRRAERVGRR
jgi:ABC-type uncharacterized transport system substrate-binding protein